MSRRGKIAALGVAVAAVTAGHTAAEAQYVQAPYAQTPYVQAPQVATPYVQTAPVATPYVQAPAVQSQCCLADFFRGFQSCFAKAPPAYAVAPVAAPVAAPVVAPVAAPPPPMMVPVQQVSYVPETTYRTEYRQMPVTSYKPSCEIDPCTGCPRECMEQVTNYVQQPVNVPVTQYRAVYSTKYVQMQPQQGYVQPAAVQAPATAVAPAAGSPWVPATSAAPEIGRAHV